MQSKHLSATGWGRMRGGGGCASSSSTGSVSLRNSQATQDTAFRLHTMELACNYRTFYSHNQWSYYIVNQHVIITLFENNVRGDETIISNEPNNLGHYFLFWIDKIWTLGSIIRDWFRYRFADLGPFVFLSMIWEYCTGFTSNERLWCWKGL